MVNLKLTENVRESLEYLQCNTIANKKKKISKSKAAQLAIQVYANFLKNRGIGD